jgi:hypothetical protein
MHTLLVYYLLPILLTSFIKNLKHHKFIGYKQLVHDSIDVVLNSTRQHTPCSVILVLVSSSDETSLEKMSQY